MFEAVGLLGPTSPGRIKTSFANLFRNMHFLCATKKAP